MMKKVYVILAVLAMVCVSSIALAADVSVGGAVMFRSRNFQLLSLDKANPTKNQVDTQERIQVDVNAKSGDVKAKIAIWNDFDTWGAVSGVQGGFEAPQGGGFGRSGNNVFGIRESWLLFPLADTGFFVKGGHQLLQLGNGMFFRSQHFGSDAWVAYRDDGPNHLGFVNVKVLEGKATVAAINSDGSKTASSPATANADDVDAYVIVDTYKVSDTTKIGVDLTMAKDRKNCLGLAGGSNPTDAQNLGLNYAGKLGPVNMKAQLDIQSGKATKANLDGTGNDAKFKGNNLYVRGDIPMDQLAVNFTIGRGSGPKANQADYNQFVNFLDVDPHYTFLYEYKIAGPCGKTNQGFCNTTALNGGAKFNVTKNLTVGADVWILQATEKVADKKDATKTTNELGTELDVFVGWKLGENLAWNWNLGMFTPGAGMGNDAATGIQGILAYTF